jgi:hypothetical protein
VELDAKQRQLIWPDAERLDLVQSNQRIQKLYPDFPGHEIEEVLLNWIDMGYNPENYSQAQPNELDGLTERWVADHLRNANVSKTRKRTRHSCMTGKNPAVFQLFRLQLIGASIATCLEPFPVFVRGRLRGLD